MTNYFATAFKTGSAPAITQDKIYLWARPHPKDADSPDPVGKPTDFILTQDTLWALVFATSDATVTLATSNTTSQTFNVTAGVNKLSLPLTPGGFIQGTLQRGGQTVVDVKPDNFTFNPTPPAFNYNTFAVVSQ
ncbi:hypothetical protein A0H81_11350 [Grifola frondosa]|uniref:Uncharacterized protein n=1 Tax=Grifola frondosa TaxID=5627 RepID=A0A1C7LWA1_GRIFR|nr:hypothetical protein A0H81_11350 [Grifola frondosa]